MKLKQKIMRMSKSAKYLIFIPVIWILLILNWLLIFEPFGSRISNREIDQFLQLMFFPIVGWLLLRVAYQAYSKVNKTTEILSIVKKRFSDRTSNIVILTLLAVMIFNFYQINKLQDYISNVEYYISNVEDDVSNVEDDVSNVEDDVSSVRNRISDVESDVSNIRTYSLHNHY